MKNKYKIMDDHVKIILRRGQSTIIDKEDLEKVKAYPGRWVAYRSGNNYYVQGTQTKNGKTKTTYLHRYIMDCPKGFVVDHIHGNTLDNRRSQLRIVTQAENLQNLSKGAKKSSKSGTRNVFYDKYFDKWVAEVVVNGKTMFKKRFKFKEDAETSAEQARAKYQPFSPEGTRARLMLPDNPKLAEFLTYDEEGTYKEGVI